MRKLTALLVILAVLGALWAPVANARTSNERECRYAMSNGQKGYQRVDVRRLIRCAANAFGVSLATAMYVADRETGGTFDPGARNESSGACGIYQHIPRYWPGRLAHFERTRGPRWDIRHRSCFGARPNVLVSLDMARHGWEPWGM